MILSGSMEFRIADTFTASLARLTGDEQKADLQDYVAIYRGEIDRKVQKVFHQSLIARAVQQVACGTHAPFPSRQAPIVVRQRHSAPRKSGSCARWQYLQLGARGNSCSISSFGAGWRPMVLRKFWEYHLRRWVIGCHGAIHSRPPICYSTRNSRAVAFFVSKCLKKYSATFGSSSSSECNADQFSHS